MPSFRGPLPPPPPLNDVSHRHVVAEEEEEVVVSCTLSGGQYKPIFLPTFRQKHRDNIEYAS